MNCDRERLRATLGRPELKRLLLRLRDRLEKGKPLTGIIALQNATFAERDAICRLMGRVPTRGATVAIALEHLAARLRAAGICPNLHSAVEDLLGAVVDRRAEQAAAASQWELLFVAASNRIGTRPELQNWLTQLRATGQLRRYGFAAGGRLLAQALDVLAVLPTSDIPLAEFAATILGDAHALDPGTSLGTLVLRAAAAIAHCEKFDDAHARRETWARVGIICDELSAAVLVLNLRALGHSSTSEALRLLAQAGEPTFLTIRQLLHAGLTFSREEVGTKVYVCENPSVLAAAARRLGSDSHPMVCIEGQPRTATRLLLNRLTTAEVSLQYHGDFDWPGLQIANTIIERHAAAPWRMSAADYRAFAAGPLLLSGAPVDARWDSDLTPTMLATGTAVHEEQVTENLLADLAKGGSA